MLVEALKTFSVRSSIPTNVGITTLVIVLVVFLAYIITVPARVGTSDVGTN